MNKRYRKYIQFAILLGIVVIAGFTISGNLFDTNAIPKQGSKAPEFTLPMLDANDVSLSDYAGQVVMVNFWGTYCPPCVNEMPLIQQYYEKYKDQGVVFLGVNENDPLISIRAFTKQYDLSFPILLDKDTVRKQYGVTAYPSTFFIDRDGKIAVIHQGEMNDAFMRRTLTSLVGM